MLQCKQNFYLLSLSSSYLYILPNWNIHHLMHKFPKLASIMRSLKKYYTAVLFYNTPFKPCMITGGETNPRTSLFCTFIPQSTYICRAPQCMSPRQNWGLSHPLSRQRVCPTPPTKGEKGTLACGLGVGESQFRRLEKKLSTLPTLWFIFLSFSRLWEPDLGSGGAAG